MFYRVVLEFAHVKLYGKWKSKEEATDEYFAMTYCGSNSIELYVQSSEDIEE